MKIRTLLASTTVHAGVLVGAAAWAAGSFASDRVEPPSLAFTPNEVVAPLQETTPPRDEPEVVPEQPPELSAAPEPAPLPILPEERVLPDIEPPPPNELPYHVLQRIRPAPPPPAPRPEAVAVEVVPEESAPQAEPVFVEARALDDRNRKPDYPKAAILRGWTGTVVLRVRIDEFGRVTDVEVVSPCRYPALNRAAVRAAETWVFEPARRGELAVASEKDIPVDFRLVDR